MKIERDSQLFSVRMDKGNLPNNSHLKMERAPIGPNSKLCRIQTNWYPKEEPTSIGCQNPKTSPRHGSRAGSRNGNLRHFWNSGSEFEVNLCLLVCLPGCCPSLSLCPLHYACQLLARIVILHFETNIFSCSCSRAFHRCPFHRVPPCNKAILFRSSKIRALWCFSLF